MKLTSSTKSYDLTGVIQTPEFKQRVKAWADRKTFGISHVFTNTALVVDYEDNSSVTTAQINKANKSLIKIIEREKQIQNRK